MARFLFVAAPCIAIFMAGAIINPIIGLGGAIGMAYIGIGATKKRPERGE